MSPGAFTVFKSCFSNSRTRQTGCNFRTKKNPETHFLEACKLSTYCSLKYYPMYLAEAIVYCVAAWEWGTARRRRPIVAKGCDAFCDAFHSFCHIFFASDELLCPAKPNRRCKVCHVDISIYRIIEKTNRWTNSRSAQQFSVLTRKTVLRHLSPYFCSAAAKWKGNRRGRKRENLFGKLDLYFLFILIQHFL